MARYQIKKHGSTIIQLFSRELFGDITSVQLAAVKVSSSYSHYILMKIDPLFDVYYPLELP
jgi:hypothetical protein